MLAHIRKTYYRRPRETERREGKVVVLLWAFFLTTLPFKSYFALLVSVGYLPGYLNRHQLRTRPEGEGKKKTYKTLNVSRQKSKLHVWPSRATTYLAAQVEPHRPTCCLLKAGGAAWHPLARQVPQNRAASLVTAICSGSHHQASWDSVMWLGNMICLSWIRVDRFITFQRQLTDG